MFLNYVNYNNKKNLYFVNTDLLGLGCSNWDTALDSKKTRQVHPHGSHQVRKNLTRCSAQVSTS